jgi:hypothetical protein
MTSNRKICRVFGQRGLAGEKTQLEVKRCSAQYSWERSAAKYQVFRAAESARVVSPSRGAGRKRQGLGEGGPQGATLATKEDRGTRALTLGDEMGERVGRGMAVKNGPEWQ